MQPYDITVNGIPMRELRLEEIVLDEEDLYALVGCPLRELERRQLAQLDGRYRRGIPRAVPDADKGVYRMDVLEDGRWTRAYMSWPDLAAAADAMALAAAVHPDRDARILRGRRAVLAYDAASRRIVSG